MFLITVDKVRNHTTSSWPALLMGENRSPSAKTTNVCFLKDGRDRRDLPVTPNKDFSSTAVMIGNAQIR